MGGPPASIAQLAEHLICNQKVIGSRPIGGSNKIIMFRSIKHINEYFDDIGPKHCGADAPDFCSGE
jgi:hypothetical protein